MGVWGCSKGRRRGRKRRIRWRNKPKRLTASNSVAGGVYSNGFGGRAGAAAEAAEEEDEVIWQFVFEENKLN